MLLEVIPRATEVFCYRCGADDIVAICHHCHRPFCRRCGPAPMPKGSRLRAVKNDEFDDLDIADLMQDSEDKIAAHCYDHIHYKRTWKVIMLCLFVVCAGAFAFSPYLALRTYRYFPHYGTLWLGYSIPFIVLLLWFTYERIMALRRAINSQPPLPVTGHNCVVKVTEFVDGSARLTADGRYSVSVERIKGECEFSLRFINRDHRRVDLYRKKYKRMPTSFEAGFVLLRGVENVKFTNWDSDGVLHLTGRLVSPHFLLRDGTERGWSQKVDYSFPRGRETSLELPVQLFPTLMREGESAWGIALVVQTPPGFKSNLVRRPEVEELMLKVPHEWGDIVSKSPFANFSNHQVTWENIKLPRSKTGQPVSYQSIFYARFSASPYIPPRGAIEGHIKVSFEGALSGLRDVILFNALGYRRNTSTTPKKQTIVTISFSFDLSGLRLRKLVSCPCRPEEATFEMPGLIPNSEMITGLIDALAKTGVYVKRVVESLPQLNKADAQVHNRYWTIIGRKYEGVFPIDFHIFVSGKACYGDSDIARSGETNFEVTTHAIVTNNSMVDKVEALRDTLVQAIRNSARHRPNYFGGNGNGNR